MPALAKNSVMCSWVSLGSVAGEKAVEAPHSDSLVHDPSRVSIVLISGYE